jgi:ParB family chromosome partitioning protein
MPLGKSLGNILGDYFGEETVRLNPSGDLSLGETTLVAKIPIKSIKLNPYQTRTQFDFEKIQSLAESIKKSGLIHPVVVLSRQIEKQGQIELEYTLLAGERRLRACKMLDFTEILAIIKPEESLDAKQQAMLTAVENLQREDLSPIELAKTFQMLMSTQNLDEAGLAETLGNSVQYVKNYLRLLTLSKPVQEALLDRQIGEGQARHLVGLSDEKQLELLELIIEKEMTVKEIQNYLKAPTPQPAPAVKSLIHNIRPEFVNKAQKLAELFPNSKLQCSGDEKAGKIVISWKNS